MTEKLFDSGQVCPARTAAKFGSELPPPEAPMDGALPSQVLTATGIKNRLFAVNEYVYNYDHINLLPG